MATIHVVSGLLWQGSRFLAGLREPDRKRPCLWETPGGKVEDGETPTVALVREWREELDFNIVVGAHIATAVFDWDALVVVDLYNVRPRHDVSPSEGPKPLDHTELRWVTLNDALNALPFSPAFYVHYPWIKRWVEFR